MMASQNSHRAASISGRLMPMADVLPLAAFGPTEGRPSSDMAQLNRQADDSAQGATSARGMCW